MTTYYQEQLTECEAALAAALIEIDVLQEQIAATENATVKLALQRGIEVAQRSVPDLQDRVARAERRLAENAEREKKEAEQAKVAAEKAAALLAEIGEIEGTTASISGTCINYKMDRYEAYVGVVGVESDGSYELRPPYQSDSKRRRGKKAETLAKALKEIFGQLKAADDYKAEAAKEKQSLLEAVRAIDPTAKKCSEWKSDSNGRNGRSIDFIGIPIDPAREYSENKARILSQDKDGKFSVRLNGSLTADQLARCLAILNEQS